MRSLKYTCFPFLILFLIVSCAEERSKNGSVDHENFIYEQALLDVEYLASDELGGRETGTEGNRMAREYIVARFDSLGLQMFGESYLQRFDQEVNAVGGETDTVDAFNLIGFVEGSVNPDRYMVVTAHYDHLGERDGEIYNGADDNASGTAALMAAAEYFTENQPGNSTMFIAFDAEEQGLAGARYFVENPAVPLDQIAINVNMDMISTNFESELYAVGTYHYPLLKPMIEEFTSTAEVDVLFGHDSSEWDQDWTLSSDHGPFHQNGVPFIYFGVEDHEHYHAPSDRFETINQDFYRSAVATIIDVLDGLDSRLDEVVENASSD